MTKQKAAGASDEDPSGIGTYSTPASQQGFGVGWTMLLMTHPLMAFVQEISRRMGRITACGIAVNVCRNFGSRAMWSLVVLLSSGNTINVAVAAGPTFRRPEVTSQQVKVASAEA